MALLRRQSTFCTTAVKQSTMELGERFALILCLLQVSSSTHQEKNPCVPSPCGVQAVCNLYSNGVYLCKCDPNGPYPVGNPYAACIQCRSDKQCGRGEMCFRNKCTMRQAPNCGKSVVRKGRIVGGEIAQFELEAKTWSHR